MKSLIACVCVAVLLPSVVTAQSSSSPVPPTVIPFDGMLTDSSGEPLTGDVSLAIAVYATADDPAPLWLEHQVVTLSSAGKYRVAIGSTLDEGLPMFLFSGGTARWLGITPQGGAEQPRMRLVTVPYAAVASTLNGKGVSDFVLNDDLQNSVRDVLRMPAVQDELTTAVGASDVGIEATAHVLPKFVDGVGTLADSTIFNPANGNLGIGIPDPAVSIHVVGAAPHLAFDRIAENPQAASILYRKARGTVGAPAIVQNNDATLEFSGFGFDGAAFRRTAQILSAVDGTPGVGSMPGRLQFMTTPMGSTSPVERMRIDSAGNVGLGTINPGARFDVNGSARLGSSTAGALLVKSQSSSAVVLRPATANGSMLLADDSELATRGITIASGGFIGIGTATPVARLHVAGTARITGDVTVDGNIGAKYQDVAEWVEAATPIEAGTVVVVDPDISNGVVASQKAYDSRVAGAVSPQPGIILGERGPNKVMVAQSGRVKVKVDARYGSIKRGDLLVTSPRAGYAMRSNPVKVAGMLMHRPGTVLGKALEPLASGTGEILVLLTLQ